MNDCIIQAVFFFHCSVAQLVLQFCPNCHIHSYILLISRREIAIFMLFTYIRNCRILFYCYTLFVSDFENTKDMSLIRVMCISFHGQSGDKGFTILQELSFESHISNFLWQKSS